MPLGVLEPTPSAFVAALLAGGEATLPDVLAVVVAEGAHDDLADATVARVQQLAPADAALFAVWLDLLADRVLNAVPPVRAAAMAEARP